LLSFLLPHHHRLYSLFLPNQHNCHLCL
jgi:hypothetical protein